MKKFFSIILLVAICFTSSISLTSCGDDNEKGNDVIDSPIE